MKKVTLTMMWIILIFSFIPIGCTKEKINNDIDINVDSSIDYNLNIRYQEKNYQGIYIRLASGGEYEIYYGAFFVDDISEIPLMFYDVKRRKLSNNARDEVFKLAESIKNIDGDIVLEYKDSSIADDIVVRYNGKRYACFFEDAEKNGYGMALLRMYNIIMEEAPLFKSDYEFLKHYDENGEICGTGGGHIERLDDGSSVWRH